MTLAQPDFNKKVVFLEIQIGKEKVGRMVIQLRSDKVPLAAENFRCLCTGEKGVSSISGANLSYKNTKFNTIKKLFMVQGGDIVKNDGTNGESIYGKTFESEQSDLEHSEGAVGMANFGKPNTNNSQFYICAVDAPHLNETNTVVGYVIRGLGIISEMEQYTSDDGKPEKDVIVSDCGEILEGEDFEVHDNDETEDHLPPFPRDWKLWEADLTMDEMTRYLECITAAGDFFASQERFVEAARKYKKAIRFYRYFNDRTNLPAEKEQLKLWLHDNSVNLAGAQLKLQNYVETINAASDALKIKPNNGTALFYRAQARAARKMYELSLDDLKKALKESSGDKKRAAEILDEFERVKKLLLDYRETQKKAYAKMFK
ncbi:peptidyl-prolyl cis-trans isomerase D [Culicoides brevitarsis]|uniref:peptidyl-prolyl cis-trans isomerase D n=1 Tax=Culicoides brevitarsis TaxID=469753 RepID=UPI00307BF79D